MLPDGLAALPPAAIAALPDGPAIKQLGKSKTMKILVAEDNVVTATLMAGILTRHGYTVALAKNGSEALKVLKSDPEIQGVITDIMMPESGGLELLRALQENEKWKYLPTLVTTVRDDGETVTQAASLGCKDYILKPVRPHRLVERVKRVFGEQKPVLINPQEVITQYSLSPESYRRIVKNFAAQIDCALDELQKWDVSPRGAPRVDFVPIMEGATLLGAERLLEALEDSMSAPQGTLASPFHVAKLEEELRLVRRELPALSG